MFSFLRPSNPEFSKAQQMVLKFRGKVSWEKKGSEDFKFLVQNQMEWRSVSQE